MQSASELAKRLDGREYREETTKEDEMAARQNGLVIVFGASDDLMEFRGAVDDEIGVYDGGTAYFTTSGLLKNECDEDDCPYFARLQKAAVTVEAKWDEGGYAWTYETTIPHATFDILEDGEKFCRGIVFALSNVGAPS